MTRNREYFIVIRFYAPHGATEFFSTSSHCAKPLSCTGVKAIAFHNSSVSYVIISIDIFFFFFAPSCKCEMGLQIDYPSHLLFCDALHNYHKAPRMAQGIELANSSNNQITAQK